VTQPAPPYVVDPDDPRAPPQEVWDRMTPEQRERVVASLPSEFEVSEASPPEGDPHFDAKTAARDALQGYFARIGRKVYLACELPVYYPGEKMCAPDVIAVTDVELRQRMSWVVAAEGKGIDLALEIHVAGDRRKDVERNTELYARLGISEYFIFDRGRLRLTGYRLPEPAARSYERVVPQGGRFASGVLGLDLALEGSRLRFFHGMAALPESAELIAKLEGMLDDIEARAAAAEERAEAEARLRAEETRLRAEETRLRAEETRLREQAERRLAEALAEIERLGRSR
jgi:Uma2 family endonuclease